MKELSALDRLNTLIRTSLKMHLQYITLYPCTVITASCQSWPVVCFIASAVVSWFAVLLLRLSVTRVLVATATVINFTVPPISML